MSEQRDIVDRLRQRPSVLSKIRPMFDEAADEIASLRTQLAAAQRLLIRIAEHAPTMSDFPHDADHLQAFAVAGLLRVFPLTDEQRLP